MKQFHLFAAGVILALPLARAQTTVFHFRVNDTDAANLPAVPSLGGTPGTAMGTFTGLLNADVPTFGVPSGAGNRSLAGAGVTNSGGVNTTVIDQIDNAKIIANGGFTFETWFKWYGGGNVNAIIDYAGTEKIRIQGGLGINFDQGSGFTQIAPTPAINQWNYVAVVFEHDGQPEVGGKINGTLSYYLNDNLPIASVPATKDDFGDSLNRVIGIGKHPQGFAGDNFNGLVYEPRVTLGTLEKNQLLFSIPINSDPELIAQESYEEDSNGSPVLITVPLRNPVGTTSALTISSVNVTGPQASSFSVSYFDPTVEANGGLGEIAVDFTPSTGGGIYTATLVVNSNDPLKPVYEIDLEVDVSDPVAVVSPSLDFGTFLFPQTTSEILTVGNLGGVTTLTLSNPRFTGEGATAYSLPGTLPEILPGSSADLEIIFSPLEGGSFPAVLTLATNDPRNPEITVSLSAIVRDPEIGVPAAIPFGTFASSPEPQLQTILADNFGTEENLILTNPQITGPAASSYTLETAFPITIPPNDFAEISVEFDPGTAAGSFLALLSFETNDPLRPTVSIALSARVAGAIDLNGPSKVSHWTFDNPADLGEDSGGLGYHGILEGSPAFSKLATVGSGALALSGNGNYIRIPIGAIRYEQLDDDGDGFTIATWVNSSSDSNAFPRQRYFTKLGASPFGFGVGQDLDTHLLATTYGIADYRTPAGVLPPQNEWHHIAYVFTGSPVASIAFYVDGNLISTITPTGGLTDSQATDFAIGGLGGLAGEWFDGMLDDLRVYAVELTPANIAELVSLGTIGPVTAGEGIAITSVRMIDGTSLRIEFKGEPNTAHQIKSSPDLAVSPFTGNVTPTLSGLTTNADGNGFVVVPAPVPGSAYFQIQTID